MGYWGFPDSSVGKESTCNAGDPGSIPRLGRSAGEGKGYPLQYSWTSQESARNVGDVGSIPGLGRSPGEGKGYPLQYSGLENSMDYMVHWVTKSQTRWATFTFTLCITWLDLHNISKKRFFVTSVFILPNPLCLFLCVRQVGYISWYWGSGLIENTSYGAQQLTHLKEGNRQNRLHLESRTPSLAQLWTLSYTPSIYGNNIPTGKAGPWKEEPQDLYLDSPLPKRIP